MLSKSIINCVINGKNYFIPNGLTVLQACEYVGITIPRFCYHDRLSIAGNCRMCLVQLDKSVKPVASCALEISSGMRIFTSTPLVKKAREGVMEFLLANHPLDCPICDQGGECDLQDQALLFGNDRGRFYESKRAVVDKDWGHLIKTVMTRCIHCTRCQRFSTELSGSPEIAMVGRGKKSEITNFLGNLVTSEVSGNVIDLCPVGALTSKPYAFTARPWELVRFEQIDNTDSLGSNVVVHLFGQKIFRVLPTVHAGLNEEWLSDRGRFFYDGVRLQRVLLPTFFQSGRKSTLSNDSALLSLLFRINSLNTLAFSVGELSLESAYYLSQVESFSPPSFLTYFDNRSFVYFNRSFLEFSKSDVCVLVGLNLKRDLPLLLVRLRFEQLRRPLLVLSLGSTDLGLVVKHLGNTVAACLSFLEGRHPYSKFFKKGTKLSFLVAESSFTTQLLPRFTFNFKKLGLSVAFSVLPTASSSIRAVKEFASALPPFTKKTSTFFLLNSLDSIFLNSAKKSTLFTVSAFGNNSFISVNRSYFFPVNFYLEETGYYLNGQGVIQLGRRALVNDSLITLANLLSLFLCFLNSPKLLPIKEVLSLARNSNLTPASVVLLSFSKEYKVANLPLLNPYFSAYSSTPVTQASVLLAKSRLVERSSLSFSFPS